MGEEKVHNGGCLCGAVRYQARGEPFKTGICHCTECRQVTGTAFLAYADWPPEQFSYSGEVSTYSGRSFCPVCGARLFSLSEGQSEVYLGTLDAAPNGIAPEREGWVKRREHWLPALPIPQYQEDIP